MYGNYSISSECNNTNHVCEVDYNIQPNENFKNNIIKNDNALLLVLYIIYSVFLYVILPFIYDLVISSKLAYKYDFFKLINMIYIVILISILVMIFIFYDIKETCLFARWCYEGINNNIEPSFYFYQIYECPRYSNWLVYDYLESSSTGTMKCDSSEYGCCEIKTAICQDAVENKNTFSTYQLSVNQGRSHWIIFESKVDEEGSNCPTIEEIIYKVSNDDTIKYSEIYLLSSLIYFILITLSFIYKYKKSDYSKLDEKQQLGFKESV